MLLDLVLCSCKHLCGRGKCTPQICTKDEMFSSVANRFTRFTCKRSHNCNVLQEVVEVGMEGQGEPRFQIPAILGCREHPQVLEHELQPPSGGKDKFSFLGSAMMISLAQEYVSRAHRPQNNRTYCSKVTLVPYFNFLKGKVQAICLSSLKYLGISQLLHISTSVMPSTLVSAGCRAKKTPKQKAIQPYQ